MNDSSITFSPVAIDNKSQRTTTVVLESDNGDHAVVMETTETEVRQSELGASPTGKSPEDDDPLAPESLAPLLSTNQYMVRKMASQALMDVALIMANISQLRTLINGGPDGMEFYYVLTTLVGLSLVAQLVFAILIFIIWVRESDQNQRQEHYILSETRAAKNPEERAKMATLHSNEEFLAQRLTNRLNYLTTVLVFFITVINMFITGFGIKLEPSFKTTANSS